MSLAILAGIAAIAIAGGAAAAASAESTPTAATQSWGAGRGLNKGPRLPRVVIPKKESVNGCPSEMASIDGKFCVDRFEASLVEVLANGDEQSWSPYRSVEGRNVRAVARAHVFPQAYISATQASKACAQSRKRLCEPAEWRKACMGPLGTTYGYGDTDEPRRCNDHGVNPMAKVFGISAPPHQSWDSMNYPILNQVEGSLAKSGEHPGCTNGYGVYDMVGNIHEWVADQGGTFYGGYYQDTHQQGDGCKYATVAHSATYHDYSTGFRCCSDPEP